MSKSSGKRVNSQRSRYWGRSDNFLTWVNDLGLEKTWFGKTVSRLESLFHLQRVGAVFLFSLTLTAVLLADFDFSEELEIGDRVSHDIKSPLSFEITDEIATEKKRLEAEAAATPVLDMDRGAFDETYGRVYSAFRKGREIVRSARLSRDEFERFDQMQQLLKTRSEVERRLGVSISEPVYEWLIENRFSPRIELALTDAIDRWSSMNIVDGLDAIRSTENREVILREVNPNDLSRTGRDREFVVSSLQFTDLKDKDSLDLNWVAKKRKISSAEVRLFEELAYSLLKATVTVNAAEMSARRAKARSEVLPVNISVRRGQMLLSEGAIVQPIHKALLSEIQILKGENRRKVTSFLAAALLVVLSLVSISFLNRFSDRRLSVSQKDATIMASVTLLVALMTKFFLFLTNTAFTSHFGSNLPEDLFLYAAPVAAGPMLVALLLVRGEIVWIFTLFLSVALSLLVQNPFQFSLVTLVGGLAAARGVFQFKKRNDIYWAGLRTGIVNSLMIFLVTGAAARTGPFNWIEALWLAPMGLLSGMLASLLVAAVVPLFESIFNCTTDLKLMELSNLNHPLLKDMIVKAPGTYHHSLVVGSMVEAAAEEIGANPLLAKVMSYYHDIGKTEHAQYFIENQKPGQNPHDQLSPHMSKTILIAHVKDGVELGLKYKLGPAIIDGIVQHHGTTLISYFYNRALEMQDDDLNEVQEEDFRYPGPKPQFRESALIMLADSIEAAARSLDEPTPARLQNIVKNIISRKFTDGQLEECDLTLKDLSVIEDAFNRVLLGIYHQRIDYPRHAGGGAADSPSQGLGLPSRGHA